MLLSRHKIILPSAATNPKGKLKKTKKILPPKQMISKWFFQEHFCIEPLVQINASACNLTYNNLGCCNVNQITTFFYLNTQFWQHPNWDNASALYKPYVTVPNNLYFWSKAEWEKTTGGTPYHFPVSTLTKENQFLIQSGWFQSKILQAYQVTSNPTKASVTGTVPVNVCRYNPNLDSGEKNKIWLVSTYRSDWSKPLDKILIYEGLPLYLMLYGYLSYVQGMKKAKDYFLNYVLAIESPALQPAAQIGASGPIVPIDNTFRNGQGPYNEPVPYSWQTHWVPNVYSQIEVLNGFVESGPLVPKYARTTNSTWELDAFYTFYFKWGGPETTEPPVTDPHLQAVYEVPDKFSAALQIRDPAKQTPASLLHPWDIRHGYFTKTALKRMSSNISTDSDFQPDAEGYLPKKRKKTGPELRVPDEETEEVQACLQALFKEDSFQETQEEDLLKLIKLQQQKQQDLKYNILRLLSELKQQQNLLKLQTGFVN